MFDKQKIQLGNEGGSFITDQDRYGSFATERQRLLSIIESQQSVIQQQLQVISNFQKASSSFVQYSLNNSNVDVNKFDKKKRKLVILNASIKQPSNMVINNHSYVRPEMEFVYPTKNSLSKPIKVCLKRKKTLNNSYKNFNDKILKSQNLLSNNLNKSECKVNNDGDNETNNIHFKRKKNFTQKDALNYLKAGIWTKYDIPGISLISKHFQDLYQNDESIGYIICKHCNTIFSRLSRSHTMDHIRKVHFHILD